MIDRDSPAGSWQRELRYPCSYRTITEHPGADTPMPCAPGKSEAAFPQTAASLFQTPAPLSPKAVHPGGFEAQSASVVASACGCRKCSSYALKVGNGVFHGEPNA